MSLAGWLLADVSKGGPGSGPQKGNEDPKSVRWIYHPKIGAKSVAQRRSNSSSGQTHADLHDKYGVGKIRYDTMQRGFATIQGKIANLHAPEEHATRDFMGNKINRTPLDRNAVEEHLHAKYGATKFNWNPKSLYLF